MLKDWHVVGQKVVCVFDGDQKVRPGDTRVVAGEIYEIRDVLICPEGVGFRFVGCSNSSHFGEERGHYAFRFRPVRNTSIECFRSLLSPTPDQIRELTKEPARV